MYWTLWKHFRNIEHFQLIKVSLFLLLSLLLHWFGLHATWLFGDLVFFSFNFVHCLFQEGGELYFSDIYTDTYVSDSIRKDRVLWGMYPTIFCCDSIAIYSWVCVITTWWLWCTGVWDRPMIAIRRCVITHWWLYFKVNVCFIIMIVIHRSVCIWSWLLQSTDVCVCVRVRVCVCLIMLMMIAVYRWVC